MKDGKPKKGKRDDEAGAKSKAFDIWLKRGLHQIYDDVANEPLPDDLLRLIEDDRKK